MVSSPCCSNQKQHTRLIAITVFLIECVVFQNGTWGGQEGDKFLMCSKKRPNNATSNYLVSMRAGDLDRNSQNFLGKLRANFVGTEFQVCRRNLDER